MLELAALLAVATPSSAFRVNSGAAGAAATSGTLPDKPPGPPARARSRSQSGYLRLASLLFPRRRRAGGHCATWVGDGAPCLRPCLATGVVAAPPQAFGRQRL